MKIAALVTIIDYNNYGNRLQNYATQNILESLNISTLTLINSPYPIRNVLQRINPKNDETSIEFLKRVITRCRKKIIKTEREKNIENYDYDRRIAFRLFSKKKISESSFVINPSVSIDYLGEKYATFIVGSDQVWNPHHRFGSPIDFLTFAPKEKRIAYAASFGVSEIPDEYIKNYKQWLSEMAYISVREESGAKIIYELTGRVVPVLVDPTLMLSKEKWMQVSETAQCKPKANYLLTYFLGEVSEEKKNWYNNLAKENNLEVVRMADLDDELRYPAGPGEFLDYIKDCSIFCTDSFHGAVFSILFEKPFVVFDRVSKTGSMSSRIDTLLSKFQLENRRWEMIKNDDPFKIDFSHVPPILEAERNKALAYLRNALQIEEIE